MNNQGWDWDAHYAKHCVRYYGWLPASVSFKDQNGVKAVKYFTLCGVKALDVFTLELGEVLSRDKRNKLPNVIICERDLSLIPDILRVVCPPVPEAVIPGAIQDILFYDDSQLKTAKEKIAQLGLKGRTALNVRRVERLARLNKRLIDHFPFHIINFDTCGSMINNKKLFEAFAKMVQLQKGRINSFLAFLTTECYDAEPQAEETYRRCVARNATQHAEIRDALVLKYGSTYYDDVGNEQIRLGLGLVKCAVIPSATRLGWVVKYHGFYTYENPNLRKMLSLVIEFADMHGKVHDSDCINEIVEFIRTDPTFFSFEGAKSNEEVLNHLRAVIKYRKNIPREYH